jgi:60S ribosome biogenesis protein Rrp14
MIAGASGLGCTWQIMSSTSSTVLKESLERHNDIFESLLKLIPPKYYLVSELTEEQVCYDALPRTPFPIFTGCSVIIFQAASKYQKHSKKLKAPKQFIKEASKKARREKVSLGKNRFDSVK